MISFDAKDFSDQVAGLMKSFSKLPRHIAKKHLQAAMKRALKPGVPMLRRNTPPLGVRRGRKAAGEKRSPGALRRSATAQAKYVSTVGGGMVTGRLGYKFGPESRKAIWLEYGTSKGIRPRNMIENTMASYAGPAAAQLADEMAKALEKAATEVAFGKNPGRN